MMVKVQFVRAAPLLVAALALAACDRGAPASSPEDAGTPSAPVERRFGDPYDLRLGEHEAKDDLLPALFGDTLVAYVGYAGGCADHDFSLDAESARDTLRLWIRHDADGDDCEAYLHDEVRLPLPGSARRAETVVLLNPRESAPIVLR